jgi:hypothetical protein
LQRSANAAARSMKTEDRSTERGTVSWLVRRYVASRIEGVSAGAGWVVSVGAARRADRPLWGGVR